MNQNNFTDIFFDLDHTLWDFDTNSALAFDKIFKKHHPTIVTDYFIEKYVPINQACWKLYQVDKISHHELRYNRLKQSFDAINYQISDQEINKISDNYIDLLPDFNHLFDKAIEVLEYLNEYYNLHIITNGFAAVQQKKINNSKIAPFFKTITNSEMAGAKKPSSIIFEHALFLAQASKEQSVMIGDCLDADIYGAISFGMSAIFFNPNKIEIDKSINQITTLAELKNIF